MLWGNPVSIHRLMRGGLYVAFADAQVIGGPATDCLSRPLGEDVEERISSGERGTRTRWRNPRFSFRVSARHEKEVNQQCPVLSNVSSIPIQPLSICRSIEKGRTRHLVTVPLSSHVSPVSARNCNKLCYESHPYVDSGSNQTFRATDSAVKVIRPTQRRWGTLPRGRKKTRAWWKICQRFRLWYVVSLVSCTINLIVFHQDPIRLPVDVLGEIARSLVTDGAYKTAAQLNQTSRAVYEETLPILYETMIIYDAEVSVWKVVRRDG